MKNGMAPTGLINASSEINDFRMSIAHRARAQSALIPVLVGELAYEPANERLKAALGRRNLPRRAFVQFGGHAQRTPERLEHRFHLMVGVQAAQVVDMQRDAGVIHEAAEKLDRQIDVERADARARERHMEFQAWTAGKIDHDARQRLVERHVGMTVTDDAFTVAD